MAPHGLKNSDPVRISLVVGNNLQKRQKALSQTAIGKNISHEAKMLTKILTEAMQHGDVSQLFELERMAIKRDRECFGAHERRTAAMASIIDAAHRFAETATPEGAKKFLEAIGGGKLPSKIPSSDMVCNTVKNLKYRDIHFFNDKRLRSWYPSKKRRDTEMHCRKCGSEAFVKNGFIAGTQRYKCK